MKTKKPTQTMIQQAASAFGRLGGRARAASLTPDRRKAIAQAAARARWAQKPEKKP